jgi:hypothetical protein
MRRVCPFTPPQNPRERLKRELLLGTDATPAGRRRDPYPSTRTQIITVPLYAPPRADSGPDRLTRQRTGWALQPLDFAPSQQGIREIPIVQNVQVRQRPLD